MEVFSYLSGRIRKIGSSFQNLFRRFIRKSSYLCTGFIKQDETRQILMILTAMLLTCCSSDSEIKAERLRVGNQGSGMTNQFQANMAKTLIV